MVGSFCLRIHPLARIGIVVYTGCAGILALILVAIAGWWKTRGRHIQFQC
jgi:hypothetical protein